MRPDGNGEGDKPRPFSVPLETFDNNWDAIFKKKPEKDKMKVAIVTPTIGKSELKDCIASVDKIGRAHV